MVALAAAIAALAAWPACRAANTGDAAGGATAGAGDGEARRGGELILSARTEPRTFNRLTSREATTDFVASLMQAKLIRINRVTDEVEPWLAESWTRSDDGPAPTP